MTVKELIEKLEGFDPQMEVEFAYNYGDHWRTEVAKHITEVDEGAVTYSDYHRMNKVVDGREDDDEEEYDKDEKMVVLLR
jgi:hypothetical protein